MTRSEIIRQVGLFTIYDMIAYSDLVEKAILQVKDLTEDQKGTISAIFDLANNVTDNVGQQRIRDFQTGMMQ